MGMKVLLLVDSVEYIFGNCYQHQLLKTLQMTCESVTIVPLVDMLSGVDMPFILSREDRILSVLKLRTLDTRLPAIKEYLGGNPVWIYEQDPWESFKDDSPYKDAYFRIANALNVKSFLNTSKWWSDFVVSKGVPSKFVTMWMLPEYCSADPEWGTRKIDVGFCGQLHPYRRELFERLKGAGISVTVMPSGDYRTYLNNLSQMKIFLHSEQVKWTVDGKELPANALWIKDVEAAARGCFSMREYEVETIHYDSWYIKTIRPFSSFDQLVSNIKLTLSDWSQSPMTQGEAVQQSVNFIRSAPGWRTVTEAMEQ